MPHYTELIFGATLHPDTPEYIINSVKYLCRTEGMERPYRFPFDPNGTNMISGYGCKSKNANCAFWYDEEEEAWHLSSRCSVVAYQNEILAFLLWIKPWIESGSGSRGIYAMVLHEDWEEPDMYYLHEEI
mgnify:CR=1 FL=1